MIVIGPFWPKTCEELLAIRVLHVCVMDRASLAEINYL